jgi:hypothetical protein
MEYGKDMWMKYLLPTGHWIYFCAQIKKGKIDSSGPGGKQLYGNFEPSANGNGQSDF